MNGDEGMVEWKIAMGRQVRSEGKQPRQDDRLNGKGFYSLVRAQEESSLLTSTSQK
jgi:hypothetical protein